MDFYGLFLGVEGSSDVIRLELDIGTDGDTAMETATSTGNLLDVAEIKYYTMSTTSTFRLLQTKGYYGRHRPCYMVNSDEPTQLKRLSTQITVFFPDPVVANPIDLFTTDWSEGVVKQGAQLLRFHLFTSMPGLVDDSVDINAIDYDHIKAVIYDMRAKEEWGKFMITSSGDGTVDASLGEECDPLNLPPIDAIYDPNNAADPAVDATAYLTQAYPGPDDNSIAKQPANKVSWIAANTIIDESGATTRIEYIPEGYYSCTSASFLVEYDGCGDGVPSNGPPEDNAFNKLHQANQRNGVTRQPGDAGYEACDDGGSPGDGCADDCSEITDGYECLKWGEPCTLKCGNGHVEGFLTPEVDSDGNIVYDINGDEVLIFEYELNAAGTDVREECDLGRVSDGGFNSPRTLADSIYEDVYMYACSADCKLIEKKWTDPAGSEYDATAGDANQSNYKKWECTIDTTPVDWTHMDIKN